MGKLFKAPKPPTLELPPPPTPESVQQSSTKAKADDARALRDEIVLRRSRVGREDLVAPGVNRPGLYIPR